MTLLLFLLFFLNILFVGAVWHMDINHHLDREGVKVTRGIFRITPETAYRVSQYLLIATLLAIDALVVFWVLA
ncbi:MAG: hypothetical protein WD850_02430 [Candidatus Spechtbacterales bacterium]